MTTIEHPFFPFGATMHRLPDNTIAFIYPAGDEENNFMSWYTGLDMKDKEVMPFLTECQDGEHSTLGSGWCMPWIEIMKQLKDFSN